MRHGPHLGRGTFATHLIESGVPLNDVQSELGHASIQTTMKYVKKIRQLEDSAVFRLGYFRAVG